jgi:hypothetical protein
MKHPDKIIEAIMVAKCRRAVDPGPIEDAEIDRAITEEDHKFNPFCRCDNCNRITARDVERFFRDYECDCDTCGTIVDEEA